MAKGLSPKLHLIGTLSARSQAQGLVWLSSSSGSQDCAQRRLGKVEGRRWPAGQVPGRRLEAGSWLLLWGQAGTGAGGSSSWSVFGLAQERGDPGSSRQHEVCEGLSWSTALLSLGGCLGGACGVWAVGEGGRPSAALASEHGPHVALAIGHTIWDLHGMGLQNLRVREPHAGMSGS